MCQYVSVKGSRSHSQGSSGMPEEVDDATAVVTATATLAPMTRLTAVDTALAACAASSNTTVLWRVRGEGREVRG